MINEEYIIILRIIETCEMFHYAFETYEFNVETII